MLFLFCIALVAIFHVGAIVICRKTQSKTEKTGFISGLLGLFSFPVVVYFGIKSFCIAGMCRHMDNTALYVSAFAFVVLAVVSAWTVISLVTKRSRA